jgi:hypothetical protein
MNVTVRVQVRWHGPALVRAVHSGLARNLNDAGQFLRREVRRDIAIQGSYVPPVHSRPGDPPYRQSGDLIRSYFVHVDRHALFAQVGSPLDYSRFLELGTSRMAPRPHLRRALLLRGPLIAAIVCTPI